MNNAGKLYQNKYVTRATDYTISAKLPPRIQHSTPIQEKKGPAVKMETNERKAMRQSLKR
jgi:hypothetical protein